MGDTFLRFLSLLERRTNTYLCFGFIPTLRNCSYRRRKDVGGERLVLQIF